MFNYLKQKNDIKLQLLKKMKFYAGSLIFIHFLNYGLSMFNMNILILINLAKLKLKSIVSF